MSSCSFGDIDADDYDYSPVSLVNISTDDVKVNITLNELDDDVFLPDENAFFKGFARTVTILSENKSVRCYCLSSVLNRGWH